MLLAALCALATLQADDTVRLTPLAQGASAKLGGYIPQRA